MHPDLDSVVVKKFVTWHDIAEVIIDDTITNLKTEEHKVAEEAAEQELVQSAPKHMQETLSEIFSQYNSQTTAEAKFVKALDKVEANLHMYFLAKHTEVTRDMLKTRESDWTMVEARAHHGQHIQDLDILERFFDIIVDLSHASGFYKDSA